MDYSKPRYSLKEYSYEKLIACSLVMVIPLVITRNLFIFVLNSDSQVLIFNLRIYCAILTTCLTGTVKEKNLTGTPILGYILPGTRFLARIIDWDKKLALRLTGTLFWVEKSNVTIVWVKYSAGTKCCTKLDWDAILLEKWLEQ